MVWRRLPAYLPNIGLKLLPLTEAQQQVFEKTGFLRELVFKTAPAVNKVRAALRCSAGEDGRRRSPPPPPARRRPPRCLALQACRRSGLLHDTGAGCWFDPAHVQVEIKHFLESVYGLSVAKVNTLNVEGKKKRGKYGFFR